MPDRPIRRIIEKQQEPILERRGGYRGGRPATEVGPPPEVPSGSVLPPATQTSSQTSTTSDGSSEDT
jgi:hypothetical protein